MSKNIGKIWVKVLNPDDNLLRLLQTFGSVRRVNQAYEITTPSYSEVKMVELFLELLMDFPPWELKQRKIKEREENFLGI